MWSVVDFNFTSSPQRVFFEGPNLTWNDIWKMKINKQKPTVLVVVVVAVAVVVVVAVASSSLITSYLLPMVMKMFLLPFCWLHMLLKVRINCIYYCGCEACLFLLF